MYSAEWAGCCIVLWPLSNTTRYTWLFSVMEDTEVDFHQYQFAPLALTHTILAHVLAGWLTSWLQT